MQRVAIVGCGAMGRRHSQAYAAVKNAAVSAVVDTNREKGEALAKELGCRWLGSMEELNPREIDFIDICLPTNLHVPAIRQASGITRNIVCEKPLALSADGVEEVRGLIREKGLRLMVAQVLRFWDCYVRARELVQSGALGKVNSIVCTRRQKRPAWSSGNWLSNVSLSGGLAYDLLIHDVDYVVWLLGKPRSVLGDIVYAEDGVPAHIKAQLRYDGCTADLFGSWGMPAGFAGGALRASLEIIGQKEMLFCDNGGAFTVTDGTGEHQESLPGCDAYAAELQYFADCCEQGRMPDRSSVDAVAGSLEVTRLIDRSAAEHRLIGLD